LVRRRRRGITLVASIAFGDGGAAGRRLGGDELRRQAAEVVVGPQYSPAQSPLQRTLGPGEAERIATLVPPSSRPGLYKLNATGTTELGEPVSLSAEFGVL